MGQEDVTAYSQAGYVTGKTFTDLPAVDVVTDAAGRVLTQKIGGAVVASVSYDATTKRMTNVSYPSGTGNAGNNTAGAFGIDGLGRPNSISWTGPNSTTITADAVTRSAQGRVKDQTIDGVDAYPAGDNFSYDGAGRLSAAQVKGRSFAYNFAATNTCGVNAAAGKNSNRTSKVDTPTGGAAVTTGYCYDNADRLTSTTPTTTAGTLAYDEHGNTKTIFGETHTYDVADRHLTTVKGTTTVAYTRDALDRIVERKVNGTVAARYSFGDSKDSPSVTRNSANAVIEAVHGLPGGAMLTTRSAGNVWSYPNIHGDIAAVASPAGAKQGATSYYDPDGNLISGVVPDNATGAMDYAWLGQHQRPLEQQSGLSPMIEWEPVSIHRCWAGSSRSTQWKVERRRTTTDMCGTRLTPIIHENVGVVAFGLW